jgi:tetratricopeptide (TPR) repeat protein
MIRDKALALRSLGRTEEELACYKAISDHFADEWSFWIRMGDIQLELGQFKSAVSSFDKALDIDSKLVPALVHRSIALSMQDNWKDAIKSANAATKLAPNDIEAWLVLGDANLRAGKHRSAMKALKQASKLDPSDPSVENTMGMASYKAGRLHDAVMHFEKALVRKKDHVSALRNLALVSMEMDAWEKASDAWTRFTSIVKNDPDAFDAQATASARLDDFCTAAEAWERARKLYKKQGNNAEAERVTTLGRAARINCSRQKKTARSQKKKERSLRRFGDRFKIRRKKQKGKP